MSHFLAETLHLEKKEVKLKLKPKGGTHDFTLNFLVEKVAAFADVGSWNAFNVVFSLLIYGIVLFPSMEDFVDLAFIHIFLSKNSVPMLLADTYYSIHVRIHKKKVIIMCCVHLLYRWFISHLPNKGPFVENKYNLKWSQRIMSLTVEDILWYSRAYVDVKVILNYGNFHNFPLICIKGGINYNPRLALRRLGYPLLCKLNPEHVEEFVLFEGVDNPKFLKKIVRAWREVRLQGMSELGKKNCIAKEAYTHRVKDKVEKKLFSFPSEPSMNIQQLVLIVFPTFGVGNLKESIKILEKENVNLRSNLGRIIREKEDLELNLNQKIAMTSRAVEEVEEEQIKRRKVSDALKGTIDSIFSKNK
ncbi:uncharacterized protein LOC127136646 [Lathyrus oleraceus]|uniref:uncharacterized protein LOC127136646 n=1 Tax=Pisum sativum TaxID=3888 RepID=UPI0021CE2601|nr:uncharacterized protein LOC127136646 [Pisum sativum]